MQPRLLKKSERLGMPDKKKFRVVIDTNLIISSAILSKSTPDKLIKSWLKSSFILLISKDQLEEMKEVSQREKFIERPLFTKRIAELVENIEFVAQLVVPLSDKDLSIHGRDPEDDFMLALGLGGNADYLVTGDQDLLILNGDPALGKLKIITAKGFLDLI